MKVKGIVWMGIQTDRFDDMGAFLGAFIGATPDKEEPGFAMWNLPDGALVELFAAGTKPSFHDAPVVGFLVDDLEAARSDLMQAGAEIVGGYGPNEDGYAAIHFKAPDGNVYEIVRDPKRD